MSITPQDTGIKHLWMPIYMKDRVYADSNQILNQLKASIRNSIVEIVPEICRKVMENYSCIETCKSSRVGNLNDSVIHV